MEAPREQAIQIFKGVLNQSTKETANSIIESLKNGEVNPAYVGVVLKKFGKIFELVDKNPQAKELIIDAFKEHLEGTGKTVEMYGAKVTVATRGYWDYSSTKDPYMEALLNIQENVKELIKARETEIEAKAATWETMNTPKGGQTFGITPFSITWENMPKLIFEEEQGEVSTNPPVKKGKEGLRYSV